MIKYVIIAVVIIVLLLIVFLYFKNRKKNSTEIIATPIRKIIFITNTEEELSEIELEENTEIPTLPTPIKHGYNFKGWYLDSELKNPLPKKQLLTCDLTLYAKWEEQTIEEFLNFMNNQDIEKDIIKKVKKTYKN